MKSYIRCKACGFITIDGRVGEVCPACGLPKKVFEPYKPPVSAIRQFWLNQHIHQVTVHLPQGFTITLFVAFLFGKLLPLPLAGPILETFIPPMILLAPFVIGGGFFTGLWDGKQRFKTLNTPFLKIKIGVGILFFILSLILAIIGTKQGLDSIHPLSGFTITGLMMLCAVSLGKIGGWITCAVTRGK